MLTRLTAQRDGFTMIELLVTIIIAGIAFLALVPVFVSAGQKSSGDNFRTTVLSVAQDKLERIRQMDYTQIAANASTPTVLPNLYNADFAGKQFGPTWPMTIGTTTRTLHVDYVVTPVPATATGIQAQYKEVRITVTWDAPPGPVKPIVLKTIVYKQYAGPSLVSFTTVPNTDALGVISAGGADHGPGVVTLRAVVDAGWVSQTGQVQFSVSAYGGAALATGAVKVTDAGYKGGGVYEWPWDATTAANGVYDFKATAYSSSAANSPGFAGNTIHRYPRIAKIVVPDPPTGLAATNGNGFVSLSWNAYGGGDLARYEVYKSTTAATGPWTLIASPTPQAAYTDYDVVNGQTYWYAVKIVTTANLTSNLCAAVQGLPKVPDSDTVAPSAPIWISCAKVPNAATIALAWQAATDFGAPATGIGGYAIWRSDTGSDPWIQIGVRTDLLNLTYNDDTAGYSKTRYYKVQPYDKSVPVNATDLTSLTARFATTDAAPRYTMSLKNTKSGTAAAKQAYVWVQDATTAMWVTSQTTGAESVTRPTLGTKVAAGATGTWANLPAGPYSVYVRWGSNVWPSPIPAAQGVSLPQGTPYVLL